jgi:hypothetical protein
MESVNCKQVSKKLLLLTEIILWEFCTAKEKL